MGSNKAGRSSGLVGCIEMKPMARAGGCLCATTTEFPLSLERCMRRERERERSERALVSVLSWTHPRARSPLEQSAAPARTRKQLQGHKDQVCPFFGPRGTACTRVQARGRVAIGPFSALVTNNDIQAHLRAGKIMTAWRLLLTLWEIEPS